MTSTARAPARPLVFVGDDVRAAGYRLGGFITLAAEPGHEVAAVEHALRTGAVVVLDPDVAEAVPPARLEHLLARGTPPVVIAPRADGSCSRADPAERVRVQLGMDA
jgi:vacuolar-type H+-ATPase subunit F/Vma7